MNVALASLLKSSIVRVRTGRGEGTGFFVAQGLVLTCAHVISGRVGEAAVVHWRDRILRGTVLRQYPAEGPADGLFPYPDIGLVALDTPIDHPVVLLDTEPPALETRLHTRGFTTTWSPMPTEEPSTFTYAGSHDVEGGSLLKLVSGETVPGMSGGPLLDLSRGVVCGIVKTSRALDSDRGGWGIPMGAVAEYLPEVVEANRSAHADGSDWLDFASQLRGRASSDVVVDIGSITEMSRSGRPARVQFTVTNTSAARVKLSSIALDQIDAVRLDEPHNFFPEGLPQYFDLSAHLSPSTASQELLGLHHVLEPGETEGYHLKITADEGWRYRVRLRITWWVLGEADDRHVWTGGPIELSFRLVSTEQLLRAVRERRGKV